MKDGKLVTVHIERQDGNATVKVKSLPLNQQLEMGEIQEKLAAKTATAAETRRLYELAAANIVEVEGIENAEGKPLTAEDFRSLNISLTTLTAILSAVNGLNTTDAETTAKNDGAADS